MLKDSIPVLRLLFWNLNGQSRAEKVAALCKEHDVGVLVLAELDEPPDTITTGLDQASKTLIWAGESRSRLHCFSLPELQLREVFSDESRKLVLFEFQWNLMKFLVGAVHMASPTNMELDDRNSEAKIIADSVRLQEAERSHSRTILIGDFNLNPFDRGVSEASGFHAVMTKCQAIELNRTVQFRDYPFFYNPMWGYLGDRTPGPPGTIYYRNSAQLSYDWNTFDQVLLRPEVLALAEEEVAVLDRCGDLSLLNDKGRPDRQVGSDHLPLLVTLHWKGRNR